MTNMGDFLFILIQSTLMFMKFILCINIPLIVVFSPSILILIISFYVANKMVKIERQRRREQ